MIQNGYGAESYFVPLEPGIVESPEFGFGEIGITVFIGDLEPVPDHRSGRDVPATTVGPVEQLTVDERTCGLVKFKIGVLGRAAVADLERHTNVVEAKIGFNNKLERQTFGKLRLSAPTNHVHSLCALGRRVRCHATEGHQSGDH